MSVAAVAFWALLIWLVVAFLRDRGPNDKRTETESPTHSAERILAERYAHGEIDSDDYHRRLEDLRGGHLSDARVGDHRKSRSAIIECRASRSTKVAVGGVTFLRW